MKKTILPIGLLAITLIAVIGVNSMVGTPDESEVTSADSIDYSADVCVWKNGELLSCSHNVLTTAGKNLIKTILGDSGSGGPVKYIALSDNSTHTPSASDTSLVNEITSGGLERAAGTYASIGDGKWNITHEFTATSDFTGVRLAGLFNQATGGTMLAENSFSSCNLVSGDKIKIVWNLTVS